MQIHSHIHYYGATFGVLLALGKERDSVYRKLCCLGIFSSFSWFVFN